MVWECTISNESNLQQCSTTGRDRNIVNLIRARWRHGHGGVLAGETENQSHVPRVRPYLSVGDNVSSEFDFIISFPPTWFRCCWCCCPYPHICTSVWHSCEFILFCRFHSVEKYKTWWIDSFHNPSNEDEPKNICVQDVFFFQFDILQQHLDKQTLSTGIEQIL